MHTRNFGATGVQVGEVGLGAWQLGGDWGDVSDATARAILDAAVDSGVTFIDTADVYGQGRSERFIGAFSKENAGRVFVATKIGRFPDPGWPANFQPETMRRHVEASIQRLGVEALDLVQLHCIPTKTLREGAVFDTLRALRDEGLIRRFGASVESMDEALLCLEQSGLASLQIIFNIFRQKPIDVLFGKARERGVAIIVRLPLASGLLSGKMTRETRFPESDHRNYNRNGEAFNVGETFAGLPFEVGVEQADRIKPMAPEGMTMAQMALRWCLDFPEVSVVIPGAKSPEQARANAAASAAPPLSADLHARLRALYETSVAPHIRGPY